LVALVGASLGAGHDARAGGEGRELSRDADRVYTVVAGDADASATVQNPANLGYLRGFNGVIDVAGYASGRSLRGSGVGVFAAIPLPFRILSLGVGVQQLWRVQLEPEPDEALAGPDEQFANPDDHFSKFTFAAAVPLERWVRGLSLGIGVSRTASERNFAARRATLLDLGLGYRGNRFVALGLVGRAVNQPMVGRDRLRVVIDPELALRPIGSPIWEIGVGARVSPGAPEKERAGWFVQPRLRTLIGARGVRGFAEAEFYDHHVDTVVEDRGLDAVRISFGIAIDTPHFGVATGAVAAAGASDASGVAGGVGRLRFSHERARHTLEAKPRKVIRLPLAKFKGERGAARLVRTLDDLARKRAPAVLIETDGAANTTAQTEEIREAILRVRQRGGRVVAYIEGASIKSYFLASAADRVIAHPQRDLTVVGLKVRTLYYGDLLAKLDARPEFVRIAEYKGTPDVYSENTATPPVAAQRRQLIDDVWNHLLRVMARARAREPEQFASWINDAPWSADTALELGIVDELAWPDELDESLESYFGKKVRIQQPSKAPYAVHDWGKRPHVAVLYVVGDLVTGPSATLPFIGKLAGSETLTKQIRKLRKDPNVRAVVVRIASRGGSVAASEDIARELDLVREKKPVIVSFGSVAASGGYYVATSGQYIFADATTITGSIGVFLPKVDLSGTLAKFGVGVDMVSEGDNATLSDWFSPYTQGQRAAAMAGIRRSYDLFTRRVGEARSLTPAQVDEVARGRVWSGVRAIDVGLVDAYGGLREAVMRARTVAELPSTAPVLEYPKPPGPIAQLRALFGLKIPRLTALVPTAEDLGNVFAESPVGQVLRELPAALWLARGPEGMMLMDPQHTID
jgi:protease-4